MTDLLTGDLIRYVIAVEMALLVGTTVFLHTLHREQLPQPLAEMGAGLLWVIGVVAVAVVVNALSPAAVTWGAWVAAVGTAPAVARGLRLTIQAVRHSRRPASTTRKDDR